MTRLAFLLWPDTFEDWYDALHVSRDDYLNTYDREWSISLARALVEAGTVVDLVHSTLGATAQATQIPSGATAHFVPASIAYRALRRITWGHSAWERTQWLWVLAPLVSTASPVLLRALHRLRADAVIIQDYETLRFDVAAPLLTAMGVRVIGLDTGASARPSRAPWKRLTRNTAQMLLAVNYREAERLRSLGHVNVDAWPVPVRTDVFAPGDRTAARQRLGIRDDERLVFAASRLHPVKNLPLLVDACRDAEARLVITGDGPERRRIEAMESSHVALPGWLDIADVVDWYAAADVVGLSSNHEGQPVAVLEAFACARGVVATAAGGVPEVVRNDETGWLVPPRDRGALAAALHAALADRERADRYGAAGRQLVLRRHSASSVAAFIGAAAAPASRDGDRTG
ncbi:MAG TPA: glycosyltransferase family 4 protein [Mycobacteriales bacterium]|nr:glycosyltransferase family 4 protein [Mycobacteriales bacterium]